MGHEPCSHDVILNGACFYCGTTDLDPVAISPKPADQIVPADRLRRAPAKDADRGETGPEESKPVPPRSA